jgi:hypothetical protein
LDHQPTQAAWRVVELRKLYLIEKRARQEALTAEQRHALRQQLAAPIQRAATRGQARPYSQLARRSARRDGSQREPFHLLMRLPCPHTRVGKRWAIFWLDQPPGHRETFPCHHECSGTQRRD